ncbi:DUF4926 domain-containing protein [Methylobacterium mesophilicum]|uniref:DUF4926 domain-containing protein n=1 Tax=Methylobacterium mesophilicum TaxID=39956 RepID=UPI002F34BB78
MSFEYTYRVWQTEPPSSLRDLDDVVLLFDAVTDDGDTILAGTEGTVVSVHGEGESYVVEFSEPLGALVTALPHQLQLVNRLDGEP